MYKGWLSANTREIKPKYCLTYRQGSIGIETTEMKNKHKKVKASEIESKKSSQIVQKEPYVARNLFLSKQCIAVWENMKPRRDED